MKTTMQLSVLAATVLALALSPARRAAADDETFDTEIKMQASLDATNCDATPPTVTVLGLTIDVSTATIEVESGAADPGEADDSTSHRHGSGGGNDPAPGGCYYCAPPPTPTPTAAPIAAPITNGCAGLVVGKLVEVRLASDSTPLIATSVKQTGNGNAETEIKAPIQGIDAGSITLLGLSVDVSGAGIDGSDNDDQSSEAIDPSQLMVGQFAEVKLASSTLPLVATELEVKNFANQVEVEIEDNHGNAINDVDDDGNPVDDISVDVVALTTVQNPTPANTAVGTVGGRTGKRLHFHTNANGNCTLNGLPTGFAKVVVTRVQAGTTSVSRRIARVRGNETRRIRIRLRPIHH
ncbi:MAG: hypothetical protein HYR72_06595 [Deltaproteobacteria bacterium]|nr:hypothetical protein [Deltaproteobacteria bacterium]MBI3387115.1 hypothetical protein [Deltaproteobacteria bacterium]